MEPASFTVLNQEPTIAKLPDNTYGDVIKVTFKTAGGAYGFVNVPASRYTADYALAQVQALADHLDQVQAH